MGPRIYSAARTSGLLFFHGMIVLIQDLGIDTVQFVSWDHAQKLPAQVKGFFNASVLIRSLAYKIMFKGITEFQVLFIQR